MIVVDASVLIEVLPRRSAGAAAESRLKAPGQLVAAPHHFDLEVANVLRKLALCEIDPKRVALALDDLKAIPIIRWSHATRLPRIWALRNNLSAYDAAYVALAEAPNAPLLTSDRRLASAPGHHAAIELI